MISASLVKELREKTGAGMLDCKKALEANEGNLDAAMDWLREKGISSAAKKASRIAAEGVAAILESDNKAVIVEINSETDFVAKNDEFKKLVDIILETVVNSDANTLEEALELTYNDEKIEDIIVNYTAKIGEKLSFRRFEVLTKNEGQVFGSYIHGGGKIAVLTMLDGNDAEVAKDVSMHAAAMNPLYLKREDVPAEVIEKERTILKEQAMNEGKTPEIAAKMVEGRVQKYFNENCLVEQPFIKDGDVTVGEFAKRNNSEVVKMVRYEVGEGMEKRNEDFACEVFSQIKQ